MGLPCRARSAKLATPLAKYAPAWAFPRTLIDLATSSHIMNFGRIKAVLTINTLLSCYGTAATSARPWLMDRLVKFAKGLSVMDCAPTPISSLVVEKRLTCAQNFKQVETLRQESFPSSMMIGHAEKRVQQRQRQQ